MNAPPPGTRAVLLALGLLLLPVGAAVAQNGPSAAPPPAAAQQSPSGAPQGAPQGVPVTLAPVTRQDVPVLLRAIGTVQAFQSVLVRARVDGTLERVDFAEGQEVKPGDLLAEIDPRPYAAALAQAEAKRAADAAQLANAQRDLARTASLARSDFASRQQLDTQQAQVAQLQASLQGDDAAIATARLNLDFCSIRAPIEGRVGLRLVDPGNLVHASDAQGLVTITQIRPIAVLFALPQDRLPEVQEEQARARLPAEAWTADDRTKLADGALLTTDNAIDPATGTIRLKAVFPNGEGRLWPGQFVNVRLRLSTMKGALTVPSAAVQHGPDRLFVYVAKPDGTAAVQRVEVAQDDGRVAVIGRGLDEGAQVVVAGQSRLQNGARIAAVQPGREG